MNDRYLYRAKRCDTGEWVEGNLLIDTCGCFICADYCINNRKYKDGHYGYEIMEIRAFEIDPSTICQCTALKDKNGKLIWENDVVRYTDMITRAEKIDRIEWNETHASFARLHRSQMGLQYLNIDEYIANGCDVIGNIFDNPELLESKGRD